MKYIFWVLVALVAKPTWLIAGCSDTIKISGYLVIQYNKEEVIQQRKNLVLKSEGKPYTTAVDYTRQEIFIPSDSISKSLKESLIGYKSAYFPRTIYYKLTSTDLSYISKFCDQVIDKEGMLNYLSENDNFYTLDNAKNDKLFKVYYIEGNAVVLNLENNSKSRSALDLGGDEVTKEKTFTAILPYKLSIVVNNFVALEGFSLWNQ